MDSPREQNEKFLLNLHSSIKGETSRAIVVSTEDPLFAGRVKVWIPSIHGGFNLSSAPDVENPPVQPPLPKGCFYPGDWRDINVQRLLPWAKCLGSNWGPRQNSTGAVSISGVFSIPKVGTEVYVVFEDNDPNQPIIIGAYFHANEFTYAKYRPLELFPGTQVSTTNVINRFNQDGTLATMDLSDYTAKSSFSYSIRAENDSMLYISDYKGESAIMLSGLIHLSDVSTLTTEKASAIAAAYPGFPTTASAAFATRILLSTASANTTLAQPNVNYNPPFQDLAAAKTVTVPSTTSAPEQPASVPAQTVKMWPVKLANGAASPHQPSVAGGAFGAPRPTYKNSEKKHVGLDIQITHDNQTLCVAPIDLIPVWSSPTKNSSAGLYLLCVGSDGTGHGFLHLYDIDQAILQAIKIQSKTIVPAGTILGHCGNSGIQCGSVTTYPFHLHWEIFKLTGMNPNNITPGLLCSRRESDASQGTSQYYNPLDWMTMNAAGTTIIQGTPDQHRSMIDHQTMYANTNDVSFAKPIGLEISTVPGQETIYLRHPSGSYIGIDCDGNVQGFSVGDFNWRGNRSWNLDILGGILETCYAKYCRVKTVIRNWAKIYANLKDKPDADAATFPDFFQRAETYRRIDMANALRSTLGNALYVSTDGTAIPMKDAYSSSTPGLITPPNTTPRNTGLTTYDKLIAQSFGRWITGNLKLAFSDWKWFKAQMLIASNGDPTAESVDGLGLFQITQHDTETVLGYKLTQAQFSQYSDPAKNIDMAMQIMANVYYQGLNKNIASYVATSTQAITAFASMSGTDIMEISFFSWATGGSQAVTDILSGSLATTITYPVIEAAYNNAHINDPNGPIILQYVPTLIWLHGQL
jgi:hypothetical protein